MEKGTIEQIITARSVVTLVPTLVPVVPHLRRKMRLSMHKRAVLAYLNARFNLAMLQWVEQTARLHSHAFEVWYIAEQTDYERIVFDGLVARMADYLDRGVASWEHYTEEQALHNLTASPHIDTVYDGDHDRVERLWRMRGYRVRFGGTP